MTEPTSFLPPTSGRDQMLARSLAPMFSRTARWMRGGMLFALLTGSATVWGQPAPEATESAEQQQASEEPAAPPLEKPADEVPAPPLSEPLRNLLEQMRQPGDDAAEALPQIKQPDQQKQRDALAHYMTGRNQEREKKFQEAYESYQQALKLAPDSMPVYRAIIPLAFRLEKAEEAIGLAQRAVEIEPDNFELLSQLGINALRQQDLAGSINYLQQAVQSGTVDKKGGPYISILSQLGQLYLSTGETERAAEAYEIVFDALTRPTEYRLDFRTQQALERLSGSKEQTYDKLGELFLLTNRLEQAQAAFVQAAQASRNNAPAYSYQQARVLAKQGKAEEAYAKLQEYFKAKSQQRGRGPYLLLKELLVALNRGDEILSELEAIAKINPDNEQLQLAIAERLVQVERLDEAEQIYEKYKKGKNVGEVQLGLLQIHRKRKQAEPALKALTQSMMHGADNERLEAELELLAQEEQLADEMVQLGQDQEAGGDAREQFAQAYLVAKLAMQRKNHDAVVDLYQRAMTLRRERQILLTLYSELITYLIAEEQHEMCVDVLEEAIDNPALAQTRQAFQLQLIRVLAQNKQVPEALAVIEKVRESDPDNLLWDYQAAWVHYSADDWEQAIQKFGPVLEKALAQQNEGIEREVRYNLSRALAFAGMAEEATELMEQSIERQPNEALWYFQRAWLFYYTHQWPEAIQAFQELIDKAEDLNNPLIERQARFSLSAAYVQNEQFDEGEKILEEVYAKDPDDISVNNDLGYLYADRGKKLEKAHDMIRKAVDAEPDNHAYLDSMGWVLYRLERYEEALKYLEKAVENSEKGDGVLWDHLGDCYHKLGKDEQARKAWKTALEHEKAEKYPNQKLISEIEAKLK